MEENYKGPTETEHLIRQAAREVGIETFEVKASTDESHIGEYSVTFKDKRGDDKEIFVPMDAAYLMIVAALKAAKSGKL
jgi:hypothetical protein